MLHMCFRHPLAHTVNMNIEVRKMTMKEHDNVLGSAVRKSGNENGSPTANHFSNRLNKTINFFFLGWVISSTIGPFDKENIRLNGLSA